MPELNDSERVALGWIVLASLFMISTGIGGIYGYPYGFISFGLMLLAFSVAFSVRFWWKRKC